MFEAQQERADWQRRWDAQLRAHDHDAVWRAYLVHADSVSVARDLAREQAVSGDYKLRAEVGHVTPLEGERWMVEVAVRRV